MSPTIETTSTISTVQAALGSRLARLRLSRNLTQASLAREAGASLSSIKRLEAGENTSMDTFLRVLKALGMEDRLLDVLPNPDVRPIERVKHGGRERRRARTKPGTPRATAWAWGEDGDT